MAMQNPEEIIWESLFNPHFNYTEFGTIRNTAGSNNFVLSVKQWIEKTGAVGITAKTGRYGGTYAHKDYPKKTACYGSTKSPYSK